MRGTEVEAHGEAKLGCMVGRTEGKGGVQSWGHTELGGKHFMLCVSGLGGPEGLGWSVDVSVSFQLLLLSPSALCCGAVIGSGMLGVTGCQWGSLGCYLGSLSVLDVSRGHWASRGVTGCPGMSPHIPFGCPGDSSCWMGRHQGMGNRWDGLNWADWNSTGQPTGQPRIVQDRQATQGLCWVTILGLCWADWGCVAAVIGLFWAHRV